MRRLWWWRHADDRRVLLGALVPFGLLVVVYYLVLVAVGRQGKIHSWWGFIIGGMFMQAGLVVTDWWFYRRRP